MEYLIPGKEGKRNPVCGVLFFCRVFFFSEMPFIKLIRSSFFPKFGKNSLSWQVPCLSETMLLNSAGC